MTLKQASFDLTQFVTPNTHVLRYPGVCSEQEKNYLGKTVLVMWSQIGGKKVQIVRKIT